MLPTQLSRPVGCEQGGSQFREGSAGAPKNLTRRRIASEPVIGDRDGPRRHLRASPRSVERRDLVGERVVRRGRMALDRRNPRHRRENATLTLGSNFRQEDLP